MPQLPMFPAWNGIHLLLIHFPLTLFFIAPIFALMAVLAKAATRRAFLISTLILMLLGTVSTYVAFATGEAAAIKNVTPVVQPVLQEHLELASLTRSSFTLATLLFGLTLAFCNFFNLRVRELIGVLPLGAAVFYVIGLLWLVRSAYLGERLVHEFGIGMV